MSTNTSYHLLSTVVEGDDLGLLDHKVNHELCFE